MASGLTKGDFMTTFIAACIVFLAAAIPAEAASNLNATGAQFLSNCTNPPPDRGKEVVALCESYVAGLADGLENTGRACIASRATERGVFLASLTWIQNHRMYGGRPAGVMIGNGIANYFPCRRVAMPATPQPDKIQQWTNIVELMAKAKPLLVWMGL
jgi:hypothetical protein